MSNNIIFADTALPISKIPSTKIVYNSFTLAQSDTVLWTPAQGQRIYLTSISISALISINVSLERGSKVVFLVAALSVLTPLAYNVSFASPIKFDIDEKIYVSTSALGSVNITLFGYEA